MEKSPTAKSSNLQTQKSKCGLVAIVGRPNVGKSTLLNHMLGQKISITSRKPQTTRHRLLGIKTHEHGQIIYVDTPGLHKGIDKAINRYMNKTVNSVIQDVDLIILLIDGLKWTEEDDYVLENIKNAHCPVILAINKIDLIDEKEQLLLRIEELSSDFAFHDVYPLSALKGHNVSELEAGIMNSLPFAEHMFPDDQITDKNSRFLAAEFVREKITRQLGDELPYEANVEIEEFKSEQDILHISALILVERDGQKRIIIGKKGERLKLIGSEARKEMETMFEMKVMLRLWVKVKSGWSDDERALRSLGYFDYE